MKKRLLAVILSGLMCTCAIAAPVAVTTSDTAAENSVYFENHENAYLNNSIASGSCGENTVWSIDEAGTLTISGTGAIQSYGYGNYTPWFSYVESITKIVINEGVTTISSAVFEDLRNVTEVTISATVTTIDGYAFNGCSALTDVYYEGIESDWANVSIGFDNEPLTNATKHFLPGGSCGENALWVIQQNTLTISGTGRMTSYTYGKDTPWYSYADTITKIVVSDGITSISTCTFEGLSFVTEVHISGTVTGIGTYAFNRCSALLDVYFDGSLGDWENISINTGNDYLKNATMHYAVNTVSGECGEQATWQIDFATRTLIISGSGAMEGYTTTLSVPWYNYRKSIHTIVIEDGITTISARAFASLINATEVWLDTSVTTVEANAFNGCSALTDVYYSGSEAEWESISVNINNNNKFTSANLHCAKGTLADGFTWVFDKDTLTLTIDGSGEMPSFTTAADAPWYAYGEFIKTVNIADSITTIGNNAFSDCTALTSISFGMVTHIGSGAFSGCTSLSDVTYAGSGTSWLKVDVAEGNEALENVTMNYGIINPTGSCGQSATWVFDIMNNTLIFSGSGKITDYGSERETPWYPYKDSIYHAIIEDGITNVPHYGFTEYESLKSLHIGNDVTYIESSVCYDCTGLETLTIGSSVKTIDLLAFSGCSSLKSVTFPQSVEYIYGNAFERCTSLEKVVFENSPTVLDTRVFMDCKNLKEVDLGNSVTFIRYGMFLGCSSLKSITIPDSVTTIPEEIFESSGLEHIELGSNVNAIDINAFRYCGNLKTVSFTESLTYINDNAFAGCYSLTDIYYDGSPAKWANITIGANNDALRNATVHYSYAGGTCGENATWYLDFDTGVLTVSGSGDMNGYTTISAPWYSRRSYIKKIVIEDGITSVGTNCFKNCTNLQEVIIGNNVTQVGNDAFSGCSDLTDVYYGGSRAHWLELTIHYGNDELKYATIHCAILPTITLGQKTDENNSFYIEIDGVSTLYEGTDGIYTITLNEDKIIKVTEKASADAEIAVSSKYYHYYAPSEIVTEITNLFDFTGNRDEKSIRLPDQNTENVLGLRFQTYINPISKQSNNLYEMTEYGYIIALQNSLSSAGEALSFDTSCTYISAATYNKDKGIDKIYDSSSDEMHILSGVFYGIPESEYNTSFVVRSYSNISMYGGEYTVYGEEMVFSAYSVAKELENAELSSELREIVDSIIEKVEGSSSAA